MNSFLSRELEQVKFGFSSKIALVSHVYTYLLHECFIKVFLCRRVVVQIGLLPGPWLDVDEVYMAGDSIELATSVRIMFFIMSYTYFNS